MSSVPQPIPLSNAGNTVGFSLSYTERETQAQLKPAYASVEPTLVSRVKGAWRIVSLGATRTAICYFFLLLLHIIIGALLVYGHSVPTLFWAPETTEVFGCGGE